jgi:hypothetical protein
MALSSLITSQAQGKRGRPPRISHWRKNNGSKDWTVYGGPCTADWTPGKAEDVGPALLEVTVHEGDVLYIPRGFAHAATGDQGLSVHLSLTARESDTAELQRALQRLMLGGLELPPRPLDDAALLDTAEQLLNRFRTRLFRITARDVLDDARAMKHRPRAVPALTLDSLAAELDASPRPAAPMSER